MEPRSPTLDQIAVFLAIVETGSFAAAGRKLGRATSAVSYAIANLESQLGLSLFVRAGASKPRLTEAGRAILSDGRGLAMALDGLIAKARGLTQGLEAEVSLVVDVMLPAKLVVKALDEFRRKFPTVGLRLRVEALGAVTEAVLNGTAMFGVIGSAGSGQRSSDPGAGRIGQAHTGGASRPSFGADGKVTSVAGTRSCSAGAHRPLPPDRGPRFRRGGGEKLAAGRSGRQACAAAGGLGLGQRCPSRWCPMTSSAGGWCELDDR